MTDSEMDIESAENSVEVWSAEYRNAQHSISMKNKWARQIQRDLSWLRQFAPTSYLLERDFSDIIVKPLEHSNVS